MERVTLFVNVIVPLGIPGTYSYRVPFELNEFIKEGLRVVVQFNKNKMYTAIVDEVHQKVPSYPTRLIEYILDDEPIVTRDQLNTWKWMANYYMCGLGEIMIAALPGSLKLASETKVLLNPDINNESLLQLTDQEFLVKDALELRGILTLDEVGEILEIKTIHPIIKRLIDKGIIVVHEEIKEIYKPKTTAYVKLNPELHDQSRLEVVFDSLKRAAKQEELLMAFLNLSGYFGKPQEVTKKSLLDAVTSSPAVLKSLIDKEIFEEYHVEITRFEAYEGGKEMTKELSVDQHQALVEIERVFETKDICLLHGVTGSGKTEVYVSLIKQTIAKGQKVLYLLPEIALTTQIISRLQKYFGDKIGIYHSKFSPNERVEVWNSLLSEKLRKYDIVLGARSAVFLPFDKLGLIIVDEEHETSFKQHDPAPRYNARDLSMVLAKKMEAKVLLGSATPSVETMWNARQNNFGYVAMHKRFGGLMLPEILCSDLKVAKKCKEMYGVFSKMLLDEMKEVLHRKEQIILFQNRRGYAPKWSCEDCGYVPMCTQCDVSLTYHKHKHCLNCHYCGYTLAPPRRCSACGSGELKMLGFGTERIEEDISLHLGKGVRVARMDLDTTRSKYAYQSLINDFEEQQIDVLVGTQMVTKGLDFDNVALVGILNADDMLFYPDFRAFERAYQLMSQVSGRAGRKNKRGKVIVQTSTPDHWIIQKVMQNDYEGMFNQEIYERKNYQYPPYFKLIKLDVMHRDKPVVDKAAEYLKRFLETKLGNRVLGPEYPVIARVRNVYHKHILVKFERTASANKVKSFIEEQIIDLKRENELKSVRVKIDVDPL